MVRCEQVDTGKIDSPEDTGIVSNARGEIGVYEAKEGVATGGELSRLHALVAETSIGARAQVIQDKHDYGNMYKAISKA